MGMDMDTVPGTAERHPGELAAQLDPPGARWRCG